MADAPTEAPNQPRSGLSELGRDLALSIRALGASFRNRDLGRALLALTAFSICEWASFIALMVFAFGQGAISTTNWVSWSKPHAPRCGPG